MSYYYYFAILFLFSQILFSQIKKAGARAAALLDRYRKFIFRSVFVRRENEELDRLIKG